MTDAGNNSRDRWYELGDLLIVPTHIYLSYSAGRHFGFEGAELVGYSLGATTAALIVVVLSQFMKRARTRSAISKMAFFTMLVFLFGTAASLLWSVARPAEISTDIDPASLDVDEERAIELAQQIENAVLDGQPFDIEALYDADRFIKKALRGQDTKSRYLQDAARSGSRTLQQSRIFEQMASLAKDGGEFSFVKFHKRAGEPILQFRVTDDSGGLHYIDFYIFKTDDNKLRIDDLRYYNSGDSLSKQAIENAANRPGSRSGVQPGKASQEAAKLVQQGKAEEAAAVIEALPDDVKRTKAVMRLRLQLAFNAEAANAEQLFSEFTERFPDDPSIVFFAFFRAGMMDDKRAAAALLDDIYETVNGDDYLWWYKVALFVAQNDYRNAIATLSEMETRYGIDVASLPVDQLSEEFRSSKEYRAWLRTHERRRPD